MENRIKKRPYEKPELLTIQISSETLIAQCHDATQVVGHFFPVLCAGCEDAVDSQF